MGITNRVIEIMDSPHADEFAERFTFYFMTTTGWNAWVSTKTAMETVMEEGVHADQVEFKKVGYEPTFVNTPIDPGNEAVIQFGPLSLSIEQTKIKYRSWDYIDQLLYDIDKADAVSTMKDYIKPEMLIKHYVENLLAEGFHLSFDHFTKWAGPWIDKLLGNQDIRLDPASVATKSQKRQARQERNEQLKTLKKELKTTKRTLRTKRVLNDRIEFNRLKRKERNLRTKIERAEILALGGKEARQELKEKLKKERKEIVTKLSSPAIQNQPVELTKLQNRRNHIDNKLDMLQRAQSFIMQEKTRFNSKKVIDLLRRAAIGKLKQIRL